MPNSWNKSNDKADMPNFNIAVIWIYGYIWYVVRCKFRNGNQKDMCLKEIGLHAQNMSTFLSS